MTARPDIIHFCRDLLGLELSLRQRVLLAGFYGLPLGRADRHVWQQLTQREYTETPFRELVAVIGARGGKSSRLAAPIALYECLLGGHQLSRGEKGLAAIVAQDERAGQVVFNYLRAYTLDNPSLRSEVADEKRNEIEFRNGTSVRVFPSTRSAPRGHSIIVGILDECAHFRTADGSENQDIEIEASLRRGQLNFPSSKLVKISTPYSRSGVLWRDHQRFFGQDDENIVVAQATSKKLNPTLRDEDLEREHRLDPLRYRREFMAEFVDATSALLERERVLSRTGQTGPPQFG